MGTREGNWKADSQRWEGENLYFLSSVVFEFLKQFFGFTVSQNIFKILKEAYYNK